MFAPQSEKIAANRAAAPRAFSSARALAGQGRPLSAGERGHAERAYGADLGHVRVHDGPSARQSADAMGAHGWSFGEHVVLGNTQRADTLNHELAHVVQQRHAPADGAMRIGARDTALEHDADRSAATGRPPELQARTREVRKQDHNRLPPVPNVQLQMPQPQAGFHPEPPRLLPPHLMADDRQRIDAYLDTHHFRLAGFQPSLDGQPQTPDAIVDRVRVLLMPNVPRTEIQTYIELQIGMLRREALMPSRGLGLGNPNTLGPPGPRAAPPTQLTLPLSNLDRSLTGNGPQRRVAGWQWALALAGQQAGHQNLYTGAPAGTPADTTLQFSATPTYANHPDGESGMEYGIPLQVAYNATTRTASISGGGQITAVRSLFDGLLQLQGFAQLMAGVAYDGNTWTGMIQPTIGAAAVVQLFQTQSTRQNISGSLFLQGTVGTTYSQPGENTYDRAITAGFQLNLSRRHRDGH